MCRPCISNIIQEDNKVLEDGRRTRNEPETEVVPAEEEEIEDNSTEIEIPENPFEHEERDHPDPEDGIFFLVHIQDCSFCQMLYSDLFLQQ